MLGTSLLPMAFCCSYLFYSYIYRDTPFPPILGPKHICNVFLDWPAEELARQITLLELYDFLLPLSPSQVLSFIFIH